MEQKYNIGDTVKTQINDIRLSPELRNRIGVITKYTNDIYTVLFNDDTADIFIESMLTLVKPCDDFKIGSLIIDNKSGMVGNIISMVDKNQFLVQFKTITDGPKYVFKYNAQLYSAKLKEENCIGFNYSNGDYVTCTIDNNIVCAKVIHEASNFLIVEYDKIEYVKETKDVALYTLSATWNLCKYLKNFIGKSFFHISYGTVILKEVHYDHMEFTHPSTSKVITIYYNGKEINPLITNEGHCVIYPDELTFTKYLYDYTAAWDEWVKKKQDQCYTVYISAYDIKSTDEDIPPKEIKELKRFPVIINPAKFDKLKELLREIDKLSIFYTDEK